MDLVNLSHSMHFCPVRFLEEHAIFATGKDGIQDTRGFRCILLRIWGSSSIRLRRTNLFFVTRNRFIIICLVFTGGIGEHSSYIRSEICSYLQWLGLSMDNLANKANAEKIDDKASAITVYVIPTDEEKIIAKRCVELVVHNA